MICAGFYQFSKQNSIGTICGLFNKKTVVLNCDNFNMKFGMFSTKKIITENISKFNSF